jgi:hypothetical protein
VQAWTRSTRPAAISARFIDRLPCDRNGTSDCSLSRATRTPERERPAHGLAGCRSSRVWRTLTDSDALAVWLPPERGHPGRSEAARPAARPPRVARPAIPQAQIRATTRPDARATAPGPIRTVTPSRLSSCPSELSAAAGLPTIAAQRMMTTLAATCHSEVRFAVRTLARCRW